MGHAADAEQADEAGPGAQHRAHVAGQAPGVDAVGPQPAAVAHHDRAPGQHRDHVVVGVGGEHPRVGRQHAVELGRAREVSPRRQAIVARGLAHQRQRAARGERRDHHHRGHASRSARRPPRDQRMGQPRHEQEVRVDEELGVVPGVRLELVEVDHREHADPGERQRQRVLAIGARRHHQRHRREHQRRAPVAQPEPPPLPRRRQPAQVPSTEAVAVGRTELPRELWRRQRQRDHHDQGAIAIEAPRSHAVPGGEPAQEPHAEEKGVDVQHRQRAQEHAGDEARPAFATDQQQHRGPHPGQRGEQGALRQQEVADQVGPAQLEPAHVRVVGHRREARRRTRTHEVVHRVADAGRRARQHDQPHRQGRGGAAAKHPQHHRLEQQQPERRRGHAGDREGQADRPAAAEQARDQQITEERIGQRMTGDQRRCERHLGDREVTRQGRVQREIAVGRAAGVQAVGLGVQHVAAEQQDEQRDERGPRPAAGAERDDGAPRLAPPRHRAADRHRDDRQRQPARPPAGPRRREHQPRPDGERHRAGDRHLLEA